tara:strand:+ start:2304 stop:2564 length:261 start_codon:yes stop_codon:yes gene_type:complete
MDYIDLAIKSLKPGSEYVFYDNDYSTIKWIKMTGKAPTQSEIDAEIVKIKADQESSAAQAAANKASAQAKLAALGLTVEDLEALGL